jgi:hypothetical protein
MDTTLTFNVVVDEQQGSYVAHCLEMGLVAVSDEPDVLPEIMSKLIIRQVEFALKNNNPSDIYHPAPREIWEKFQRAIRSNKLRSLDKRQKPLREWPGLALEQSYACAYC